MCILIEEYCRCFMFKNDILIDLTYNIIIENKIDNLLV